MRHNSVELREEVVMHLTDYAPRNNDDDDDYEEEDSFFCTMMQLFVCFCPFLVLVLPFLIIMLVCIFVID